jgi:hypothetical protein
MKLTEAQLRSRVRREILSSMGDSAPVVYEGFLSDTWATLKSGAAAAAEKVAEFAKDPKEKVKSAIDDVLGKVDADSAAMKKLEETGSPDAWALYKAVAGFGTDEDAVRKVLEKRAGDLKVLSKEWSELTFKLNEIGLDTKEAVKEVASGAAVGAAGGAAVGATLGAAVTIMSFLGLTTNPVTLPMVLGTIVTGGGIGLKAGATVEGLDELKKWAEMKIDPSKTLAEVLADEGMDEEAQKVSAALKEGARKLRVTKRQLGRIIKEATDMVNRETGEVISFGDKHNDVAPDKAVNDIMKRLGISPKPEHMRTSGADGFNIELSHDDFMKVEDETIGKQDSRARKRKSAQMAADRERLNIDNLLQRLSDWAEDTASDYMADNPDMDLQDIAYDLADAWEFEFEKDEREELLWHFDGDLNDLKIYAAESMG